LEHIPAAIEALKARCQVLAVSTTWRGPAIGSNAPDFVNAVVEVETPLTPEQLKAEVLAPIEGKLGRKRTGDRFAPRTIDLDIVVFGSQVVDADLWSYGHLAVPLAELNPLLKHPETGEELREIAARLRKEMQLEQFDI
jgi:2-amino-4-hydroxy-6-hydroxymethyldihydropteridine diphosphokinase